MPAPASSASASARAKTSGARGGVVKRRAPSPGGLLATILGDVKRANAARAKATALSGGKKIDREDVLDRESRAHEARKRFERETRERLAREVAASANARAFAEFEKLEKQWRNVVHEIAAEMKLFSESVEIGEEEEKLVIVYKTDPELARGGGGARGDGEKSVEKAATGLKRGEALSDKAPQFASDDVELTVVGTVKRDLRSVEETILDMKKAKEARPE